MLYCAQIGNPTGYDGQLLSSLTNIIDMDGAHFRGVAITDSAVMQLVQPLSMRHVIWSLIWTSR